MPTQIYGQPMLSIIDHRRGRRATTVTVTVTDNGNGGRRRITAPAPVSCCGCALPTRRRCWRPSATRPRPRDQPFNATARGGGRRGRRRQLHRDRPAGRRDARAAHGTFTWTPAYGQAGNYPIALTASRRRTFDQRSDQSRVAHVARARCSFRWRRKRRARARIQPDHVQAADLDGDPVACRRVSLPAGATFDPTTGVFDWFPSLRRPACSRSPFGGEPRGADRTLNFTIDVQKVDQPPVSPRRTRISSSAQTSSFTLDGSRRSRGRC